MELQERLREIESKNNRNKTLVKKLIGGDIPKANTLGNYEFSTNMGQNAAIAKVMSESIVFIWGGPPGTGKTYTLANIALKTFFKWREGFNTFP